MNKASLEIPKSEDGVVQICFLQKSRQVDGTAVYSLQQNPCFVICLHNTLVKWTLSLPSGAHRYSAVIIKKRT